MAKLKPLGSNVVIKPATQEELTKSGIILPDTVDKERPEKGEVIAVGPGRILENGQRSEMSLQTGQKVMFKKYSPDEIKIDGEEYLVLKESEVLAIIE